MRMLWLLPILLPLASAALTTNIWGDPDPGATRPPLQPTQNAFEEWKLDKIPAGPERQTYLKHHFNRYLKGICKACIRGKARSESYVSSHRDRDRYHLHLFFYLSSPFIFHLSLSPPFYFPSIYLA